MPRTRKAKEASRSRRAPSRRARRTVAAALCVLLVPFAVSFAPPASAAEIAGVRFPKRREVASATLVLHNVALLRWGWVLKVYAAALYLGEGHGPRELFRDVPKRLEIEHFRSFRAEQFAESTRALIERNVSVTTFERLRPRVERLNRLYRDVEPGDRYALTYVPDWGTELALNGRPLGRIEGADFAAAVFSIWLGERPLDEGLKRDLFGTDLGDPRERAGSDRSAGWRDHANSEEPRP